MHAGQNGQIESGWSKDEDKLPGYVLQLSSTKAKPQKLRWKTENFVRKHMGVLTRQ